MTLIAFDIETSVITGEPACVTWCEAVLGDDGRWMAGAEMGLHARDPAARATFAAWLADDAIVLVGQSVAFDMCTLGRWWGLLAEVRDAYAAGRVRDTMLRQDLIDIAWPAKPHVAWSDEFEKWFPGKLAWHKGLGKNIRLDKKDDDDGGGSFAKGGLDHLAWRLLAINIASDKHDVESPRLRYHEVIEIGWDAWPEKFRTYALGDPRLTLEVFLEQAAQVRDRIEGGSRYAAEGLPWMFADGWTGDEVDAPLCDEQFQCMAAVPFQLVSARGVMVDEGLVRGQRAELHRLAEWASDLCVKHGTMIEIYEFEEIDKSVKMKPLRKGEQPTQERMYRSWRSRWKKLREEKPEKFAEFLELAESMGRIKSITRKGRDDEERRRVVAIAERRGVVLPLTKSGQDVQKTADIVYELATPTAEQQAADPAAADLAEVLGPNLLKLARKCLAGTDAEVAERDDRTEDAARLRETAGGWSLARLQRAIESSEDPGLAAKAVQGKAVKFDTSFLRALEEKRDAEGAVHAWFRTMMDTGRTSMTGAIRQNMPKTGGIRECIVPRPGYVFVQCDYSQIELLGLAYVLDVLFGHESALTVAIREGRDCHLWLACHPLLRLGLDYVTAWNIRDQGNGYLKSSQRDAAEREHPDFDWALFDKIEKARFCAKAANFGFPGGMMPRKFALTQKKQANLILSIEEATTLREAWLATWPEIARYFEWAKAKTSGSRTAKVRHLDGTGWHGHWRGGCGYTQLCNTLFQGLVARGAKWAAWQLFEECYLTPQGPLAGSYTVLFVHDEFVLEVPVSQAAAALVALRTTMEAAMLAVMPGQAVKAEGKILVERWTK